MFSRHVDKYIIDVGMKCRYQTGNFMRHDLLILCISISGSTTKICDK